MPNVECDEEINIKHMWEQVKQGIVENAGEVCGLVRVGGKEPIVNVGFMNLEVVYMIG